ncbi:MAG: SPW repeat domain-containing protein [Actinomycetota bacterium]
MANPLVSEGPVPFFVHGVIEYLAGVAFIAAPLVLDFPEGASTTLSIVLGVLILLIAATTEGPTGLIEGLALTVHVVLDYVLALFLIAAPFLFSFSQEAVPTAFFIVFGIVHLLLTVGTRFMDAPRPSPESERQQPS